MYYSFDVSTSLHRLSAWLFYLLGGSFFVAYMLQQNNIAIPWPEYWLRIADLPLLMAALTYGGTSLYRSVRDPKKDQSPVLASIIIVPVATLMILFIILNFWPLLQQSSL